MIPGINEDTFIPDSPIKACDVVTFPHIESIIAAQINPRATPAIRDYRGFAHKYSHTTGRRCEDACVDVKYMMRENHNCDRRNGTYLKKRLVKLTAMPRSPGCA